MTTDSAYQSISASNENAEEPPGWPGTNESYRERMLTMLNDHRCALLAYLRRMRLAPEDAEDVLQDTCIRLLSARDSWRGERSAFGFIYKIAGNLARDELRRRRRRGYQQHCSFDEVELACSAPHPAETVEQSRAAEDLSRVLARLTPRCQTVVSLHYAENMSFRLIAKQLGVSKKTIERDLTLARDFCHAVLERAF